MSPQRGKRPFGKLRDLISAHSFVEFDEGKRGGGLPHQIKKNANNCCIMLDSVNSCLPFLVKNRFLRFSFVDLVFW